MDQFDEIKFRFLIFKIFESLKLINFIMRK